METTGIANAASRGRFGIALAPLRKLTVASLLLAGLIYIALLFEGAGSGGVELFGPHVVVVVALALAVAAGFRWTPGLAAFVMAALFAETLVFAGKDLTSPGELAAFAQIAILVAILAVGICAGVGETVQSYRRPVSERHAPAWLPASLVGVFALVLGGIVTMAIQQPQAAAAISPETLRSLPAVTVKGFQYDQAELHAKVGETVALRLDNADTTTHYFEIDDLGVHTTMSPGKSSLTVFRPTKAGTYTIYCSPHSDKQAHTGMISTLVVTQ